MRALAQGHLLSTPSEAVGGDGDLVIAGIERHLVRRVDLFPVDRRARGARARAADADLDPGIFGSISSSAFFTWSWILRVAGETTELSDTAWSRRLASTSLPSAASAAARSICVCGLASISPARRRACSASAKRFSFIAFFAPLTRARASAFSLGEAAEATPAPRTTSTKKGERGARSWSARCYREPPREPTEVTMGLRFSVTTSRVGSARRGRSSTDRRSEARLRRAAARGKRAALHENYSGKQGDPAHVAFALEAEGLLCPERGPKAPIFLARNGDSALDLRAAL